MKVKNIIFLVLLPSVLIGLLYIAKQRRPSSAFAYGPLTIDLGVPSGEPIFTVANMLPGDCEEHTITITNDSEDTVDLVVHSDNVDDSDNLSSVMSMLVTENGNTLYSDTLTNFFSDSQTLDGISLLPVNPNESKQVNFKACMSAGAENEFQKTKVIFDLIFGEILTPFQLPEECSALRGKIAFKIEGTEGDDDIRATRANELILGYGGNDDLDGAGGDDCIVGGDGRDKIDGGQGSDIIIGGIGDDEIEGGQGADLIFGGQGKDEIDAGQDDDIVYGQDGNDRIDGRSGKDYLYGGNGDDQLDGGSHDDHLYGENGNDKVKGGSGTDYCEGETQVTCEN